MYKAIITKDAIQTHEIEGSTEAEVLAFIDEKKVKGVYGKLEYWVTLDNATEEELLLESSRRTINTEDPETLEPIQYDEILIPQEFTVQVVDITAQKTQEETNKTAMAHLVSTDWLVLRHQGQIAIGITTSLTAQEYLDLETARQASRDSIV